MTKLDVKVTRVFAEDGVSYRIQVDLDSIIGHLKDRALELDGNKKEFYMHQIQELDELRTRVIEWAKRDAQEKDEQKERDAKKKKSFWERLFG